jgi:hypothetical protein
LSYPVLYKKPGTQKFIKEEGFGLPYHRKVYLAIMETNESGILDNYRTFHFRVVRAGEFVPSFTLAKGIHPL